MSVIKDYLCHVANTVFCAYQNPFCELWDAKLLSILRYGEFLSVGEHTIKYAYKGDVLEIWIANKWYSNASLYRINNKLIGKDLEVRPRFKTMRLLHEIVMTVRKSRPENRRDFYTQLCASDEIAYSVNKNKEPQRKKFRYTTGAKIFLISLCVGTLYTALAAWLELS